jgi:hypothetical protein
MRVSRFTLFGIVMALLVGCSSPGTLVLQQDGEMAPKMGKVPDNGNYGLFIAGQSQELLEYPLKKDEPLGFEWGNDDVVKWMYAVAGSAKNRLDVTKTYEWRRMK